jgi:hypothetical protein
MIRGEPRPWITGNASLAPSLAQRRISGSGLISNYSGE